MTVHKTSIRLKAVMTLIACLILPSVVHARSCADHDVVEAFAVRDLQSRLLVAALACDQRGPYNSFVMRYQTALRQAGRHLIQHFSGNADGQRRLDNHVTRAANAAAYRHAENQSAFCQTTSMLFTRLMSTSATVLVETAKAAQLPAVQKPSACYTLAAK